MTLIDLQADKLIKPEYNETTYINERLTSKGFAVNGNIVLVDGWQFEIDRSVPRIATSLGRGEIETNIVVNVSSQTREDYVNARLTIEIAYENEITEIILNGNSLDVPEKNADGKYVITIDNVTANGLYSVVAKAGDKINIGSTIVSDITEDIEIRNANELVAFRDRVNNGATFEGRTVTVVNDIDLAAICHRVDETTANDISWTPIGTDTKPFKGIFNGNDHTINNLYINTVSNNQGLFGVVNNATISHVKIGVGSKIKGKENVAGIVGNLKSNNAKIEYCINNAEIIGVNSVGGILGYTGSGKEISNCGNTGSISSTGWYTGGILGSGYWGNTLNILKCYNTGSINSTGRQNNGYTCAGGIAGVSNGGTSSIEDCYNIGTLSVSYGMVGGITGNQDSSKGHVKNCYNVGNIICNKNYVGSIGGYCTNVKFMNCYWTTNFSGVAKGGAQTSCSKKTETELKGLASTLGDAFIADGKIKNAEGEWVDHLDEEENIIYINKGYPVLKWQVE